MHTQDIIEDIYFGHDVFQIENDLQYVYIVSDLISEYDHENISLIYLDKIFKLDKRGHLPLLPEIGQI